MCYFKVYFHNFWLDWVNSIKELRSMPKEQHDALICERLGKGMLNMFPESNPNSIGTKRWKSDGEENNN
jgi:hypothetical protein